MYLDCQKSSLASSDQKFWLTSPACCLTYFLTIIIKTVICAGAGAVQIGQSNREAYSKGGKEVDATYLGSQAPRQALNKKAQGTK